MSKKVIEKWIHSWNKLSNNKYIEMHNFKFNFFYGKLKYYYKNINKKNYYIVWNQLMKLCELIEKEFNYSLI